MDTVMTKISTQDPKRQSGVWREALPTLHGPFVSSGFQGSLLSQHMVCRDEVMPCCHCPVLWWWPAVLHTT